MSKRQSRISSMAAPRPWFIYSKLSLATIESFELNQRKMKMENMIFNVAQLMKAPVGTSLVNDFHEEDIQLDDDIEVVGPIDGHVRMRRTNQGLLVDGWVELTLELSCNRCLKTFEQPMHVDFEEQFYPTVDVISGMPL